MSNQDTSTPTGLWAAIDDLWTWLDENRPIGGQETMLLRMLKLSEEVAEAVIGVTGQNPRKGVSHTWEDVQGELCDVVIRGDRAVLGRKGTGLIAQPNSSIPFLAPLSSHTARSSPQESTDNRNMEPQ